MMTLDNLIKLKKTIEEREPTVIEIFCKSYAVAHDDSAEAVKNEIDRNDYSFLNLLMVFNLGYCSQYAIDTGDY